MLTSRLANNDDLPKLTSLMATAIAELQRDFLNAEEIDASRDVMGLDTQLIEDGNYFVVEEQGRIVGCGGWSPRSTLYGGDHSAGRDAALLDPRVDPARIRAMYTHPDFARRGVGRLVLSLGEEAAAKAGFSRVELMATLSGEMLYRACGYQEIERIMDGRVPLVRMSKAID